MFSYKKNASKHVLFCIKTGALVLEGFQHKSQANNHFYVFMQEKLYQNMFSCIHKSQATITFMFSYKETVSKHVLLYWKAWSSNINHRQTITFMFSYKKNCIKTCSLVLEGLVLQHKLHANKHAFMFSYKNCI